jgi:hypothetical protein
MNPTYNNRQGAKVLVSSDGNTLFAGTSSGGQYIYSLSAGAWTQEADLAQQNGFNIFSHQGNYAALSADGNTALLGYESFPVNGVASGTAFFFSRTNGVWTLQAQVTPPNLNANSNFLLSGSDSIITLLGVNPIKLVILYMLDSISFI